MNKETQKVEQPGNPVKGAPETTDSARPRPVFIIGAPRSGTSILTWCLSQHPNIMCLPETNWLAALGSQLGHFYSLGTLHGRHTHLSRHDISREEFFASFGPGIHSLIKTAFEKKFGVERERLRQGGKPRPVRARIRASDDPKLRWVDGTPANSSYVAALAMVFPDAKFVHLTRDPDAVLLSLVSHETLSSQFGDQQAALEYVFHTRRTAHLAEVAFGREKVIRTDLDRVLASPETELARLMKHLGEAYEPHCTSPLAEKINETDEHRKQTTTIEWDADASRLLEELRVWQQHGADESWSLPVDPVWAHEELETYCTIPINRPPSTRQLRLD